MYDERSDLGRYGLWLTLAWVGGGAFLVSALTVDAAWMRAMDGAVIGWLEGHRVAGLTAVARETTALANATTLVLIALVAAVLLDAHHRRRLSLLPLAAMVVAIGVNYLAKALFGRDRPQLLEWLTHAGHHAFPSGHALYAAAGFITLAFSLGCVTTVPWIRWAVWIVAVGLVLAVGLSRVYLGVHWPSDVLGGWGLGCAVAGAAIAVAGKWSSVEG